jgi:hypothetical protein
MTALLQSRAEMPPLAEIIELKWLLVGEGVHLHVERMMSDGDYARRALDHAAGSSRPALRAAAARLRCRLEPSSR